MGCSLMNTLYFYRIKCRIAVAEPECQWEDPGLDTTYTEMGIFYDIKYVFEITTIKLLSKKFVSPSVNSIFYANKKAVNEFSLYYYINYQTSKWKHLKP